MADEDQLAELLALIAAGRPERLVDVALGTQSSSSQHAALLASEFEATSEAFASLALAGAAVDPPAAVRARLMATLTARARTRGEARRALLVVDMINDHLAPGK